MSVPSWVAYGADGRPFGFATKSRHTLKQAAREFPDAVRIELVEDGEEVSRLIAEWAKP